MDFDLPRAAWQRGTLEIGAVIRRIDRTARRMGLEGEGDSDGWPNGEARCRTLGQLGEADALFLTAKLGPLPGWLRRYAIERCRQIVATSYPVEVARVDDTPRPVSAAEIVARRSRV